MSANKETSDSAGSKRQRPFNPSTTTDRGKTVHLSPIVTPNAQKIQRMATRVPSTLANETLARLLGYANWCKSHKWFDEQYGGFEASRAESWSVAPDESADWSIFGLDCEMVMTRPSGSEDVGKEEESRTLARVSVVRCVIDGEGGKALDGAGGGSALVKFDTVLDEFVRVDEGMEVVDFATEVSGVEPKHVEAATFTLKDVQLRLKEILRGNALVLGHALWSDFTALGIYHPWFIDTSFLFSVNGLPKVALSLKDAFEYTTDVLVQRNASEIEEGSNSKTEVEEFQPDGQSHDSVVDARVSVQVVLSCLRIQRESNVELNLPFTLPGLPERFRRRLTLRGVPEDCGKEAVNKLILDACNAVGASVTFSMKPPKWRKGRDGVVSASLAVEFETSEHAKQVFDALPTAPIKLSSSGKTLPTHPDGWPGQDRHKCKLCPLAGAGASRSCEVISYFPCSIQHVATVGAKRNNLGKIYGRFGNTIKMIQRCTGTCISTLPLSHKDNFKIESPKLANLDKARNMIKLAAQGEYS